MDSLARTGSNRHVLRPLTGPPRAAQRAPDPRTADCTGEAVACSPPAWRPSERRRTRTGPGSSLRPRRSGREVWLFRRFTPLRHALMARAKRTAVAMLPATSCAKNDVADSACVWIPAWTRTPVQRSSATPVTLAWSPSPQDGLVRRERPALLPACAGHTIFQHGLLLVRGTVEAHGHQAVLYLLGRAPARAPAPNPRPADRDTHCETAQTPAGQRAALCLSRSGIT